MKNPLRIFGMAQSAFRRSSRRPVASAQEGFVFEFGGDEFERAHPGFGIDLDSDPETQRILAEAKILFEPLVGKLNETVIDRGEGRTFRLLLQAQHQILLGGPEVRVTIGHFNDIEETAMRFYMSEEGGWVGNYRGGSQSQRNNRNLNYTVLAHRSFQFDIPVGPSRDGLVYFGMWKAYNTPASQTTDPRLVVQGLIDHLFGEHSILAEEDLAVLREALNIQVPPRGISSPRQPLKPPENAR